MAMYFCCVSNGNVVLGHNKYVCYRRNKSIDSIDSRGPKHVLHFENTNHIALLVFDQWRVVKSGDNNIFLEHCLRIGTHQIYWAQWLHWRIVRCRSTESKPPKQRKKRLVLVGIDTRSAVFQSRCTNAFFPIDTSVGIFLSIVQVSFIKIPSYRRCFLDWTIEFADGWSNHESQSLFVSS